MTYSEIETSDGMSDQSRAYWTGVTVSCGSRSTCMCNIRRQNEARRSNGNISSATHLYSILHNITLNAPSILKWWQVAEMCGCGHKRICEWNTHLQNSGRRCNLRCFCGRVCSLIKYFFIVTFLLTSDNDNVSAIFTKTSWFHDLSPFVSATFMICVPAGKFQWKLA